MFYQLKSRPFQAVATGSMVLNEYCPELEELFVLGKEVEAFESEFSVYCNTAHCIGVANGLDAIELILRAYGIGAGDEVIVPSNTFIATWLAVTAVGATVIPVEPDPETYNLDPNLIENAITERTRAIIAVHLYGQSADMDPICRIALFRRSVHFAWMETGR